MEALIRWLFLILYIFIAYRFTFNSVAALIQYHKNEQRPYEIIPGTITAFEQGYIHRLHSTGKRVIFYPIFEYQWKGKFYRKRGRRVMAKFGKGFTAVPATDMQVGDRVEIRIFPQKPGDARIEESHYFWRSRTWVNIPGILISGTILVFGIYCAVCSLVPGN